MHGCGSAAGHDVIVVCVSNLVRLVCCCLSLKGEREREYMIVEIKTRKGRQRIGASLSCKADIQ